MPEAKKPLPLDCGGYISLTTHLSPEQHGACFLLLMATWHRPLGDDNAVLARVCGVTKRRFINHIRPDVEPLFEVVGGYWHPNPQFIGQPGDGRLPPAEWAAIRTVVFRRDNFTCTYCGQFGRRLECDHKIPVSRGGSNDLSNLTTACFDCNREKGARTLDEWRALPLFEQGCTS